MFGQKRIPSREGGVEIVVEELCTRMVAQGHNVTCYNRGGHHVSGSEYDSKRLKEYKGIKLKTVPTIEKKGLAAVSSSFFAALCCAFGQYDIVHIHAEGPAFFAWLPKMFGKKVIVTIHGLDWQREKWKSGFGSKFIHQGEKNAVKFADEIIVLKKGMILNKGTTDILLKEIQNHVWECFVNMDQINLFEDKFIVSNRKYTENGAVLRIISTNQPALNAKKVEPSLEDLYLYYFREEGEN